MNRGLRVLALLTPVWLDAMAPLQSILVAQEDPQLQDPPPSICPDLTNTKAASPLSHTQSMSGGYLLVWTVAQTWNGATWQNNQKDTCVYNAFGLITENIHRHWGGTSWVNVNRYAYIYAGDTLMEKLSENYDGFNWIHFLNEITTYDSTGRATEFLRMRWVPPHWVNDFRRLSTYDGASNLTMLMTQNWAADNWKNADRWLRVYDALGNMIEEVWEQSDGTNWVPKLRLTVRYTATNTPGERRTQQWFSSNWINYQRYLYAYGTNDSLTEQVFQEWGGFDWVNVERHTYAYSANNELLEDLFQSWINPNWVNIQRIEYTIDGGHRTERREQHWDGFAWSNVTVNNYAYDVNGNLTEDTFSRWDGTAWYFASKTLYGYRSATDVITTEEVPLTYRLENNYPNPFNPITDIGYQIPDFGWVELAVYDLLGREVAVLVDEKKAPGRHAVTFDARGLASGVYFYRLTAGHHVEARKMMLTR